MKKRVAIIGGGQIAETVHLPYYQTRKDIDVVAVVSKNKDNVKEFAKTHGIPHYYTNSMEMLEAEKPDIVSVCTPNRFHYNYVKEALEFGCDVLCEKPPAIMAEHAKEMYEIAEKNHCILAYNFQHRFSDDVQLLRKSADEGVLGDIYAVKALALRRSGVPGWGNFINKQLQGGGPLIDLGIHMLDAALYILDFPRVQRVTAKSFQKIGTKKSEGTFGKWDPEKYDVEDSLFGFIELEGGRLLQIETSFALHMKDKSIYNVEFFGDKAGATLYPAQIYTDDKGELVSLLDKKNADENRSIKSLEAFLDRCFGKNVMIANGKQGYRIQQLIEALYDSAETGESIIL